LFKATQQKLRLLPKTLFGLQTKQPESLKPVVEITPINNKLKTLSLQMHVNRDE